MKRKLHRSRRSVFGKKEMPRALKVLLWTVACVAVVALGYFGAMLVSEGGLPQTQLSVGGNTSVTEKPGGSATDDEHLEPDTPAPPTDTPAVTEAIRAFYLPHSALVSDTLDATLSAAYKAGFNAVVFDLKDAEGTMYYRFSDARAKKVDNFADNAFTADGLSALFDRMKEHGLQPIPRLYAFCDDPAAKVLTDARIGLESNHSWAWYDGDPNNGGKKWLNPYSEVAREYLGCLAEELKTLGAAAIMLDGVQFPSQLGSAYLGEQAATVDKAAALTAFVESTRARLGNDCPVILCCTSAGALATDTKIYGGNPLTFGPAVASPLLTSKVKESVEAMHLRTQVLEDKPVLAPVLMPGDTAAKVNAAIAACIDGGADSFILYAADGTYDFAAYNLG